MTPRTPPPSGERPEQPEALSFEHAIEQLFKGKIRASVRRRGQTYSCVRQSLLHKLSTILYTQISTSANDIQTNLALPACEKDMS